MNLRRQEFVPHDKPLATWWRQESPGTYYWRCLIPARHLPGRVNKILTVDLDEKDGKIIFPRQQGTAIFQFPGNATGGTIMAGMQSEGIRVLVEVDDNYFQYPDVHGGAWQAELDRCGSTDRFSFEAHKRICRFADGIIVSTEPLAALYRTLNENVFVCPNSVEPDDWPDPVKPDDGVLRIGWAASHSHVIDAPLVHGALRWAADQKDVEVLVYGIGDVYRFPGRVKKVGWTDSLEEYRRSLALCDVHICPLIETEWSQYKSDVKALEAAMAGAWPIVSSATPYRPWHDRTMVCKTKKDWKAAMRWVVGHRDEIAGLAREARDYVMGERQISHSIGRWREAVCA